MRSGLGWRSLDPVEAVADVHSIENKDTLLRIAYEARNPEARRLALIKMGDKRLMESFARSDLSPIVRRRMVRELDDIELVRRIAEEDDDRSVRDSAYQRLAQLEALREEHIRKSAESSNQKESGDHEKCDDHVNSSDHDESLDHKEEQLTADGSNGHEYVDLGLSVKWAAMNVGASKVSDRGGYYAWGETGNKDDYTWSTYLHGTSADALSKYSYTDHGLALQAADDAAHVNWGGAWRIPTEAEWEELCDRCNCAWEWTSVEGTPGYRVTSRKAGYTDKSIFLPAAGYYRGCSIEGADTSGYYWSSTRNRPFADRAICLYFIPTFIGIGNNGFRNGGFTIRPVR